MISKWKISWLWFNFETCYLENSKEGEDDIDETGSDDDDCCCDESIPECDEYDSDAEQNEQFDQTKIQNESNFTNTPIGSVSSSNFNPTSSQNINEQPLPSSPGMDMPWKWTIIFFR